MENAGEFMKTPICDFIDNYIKGDFTRLHMPGHKGNGGLGFEAWDITEVSGADSLYEAAGVIAESEGNATEIFESGATFYSAEGSSQVIKAMLYLLAIGKEKPLVLAARNVHKAFIYGCALNDIAVEWMYSEIFDSLCSCVFLPDQLEEKLKSMSKLPDAVYITAPDYLGNMPDIKGMADICGAYKIPLIVDNAHGAYLKFLPHSLHPLDLGAAMCCDSAHKTLPVLTGGAYLQISKKYKKEYSEKAKNALALFGSTSPSYLIMASLDSCNSYLTESYPEALREVTERIKILKSKLALLGYDVLETDPLKITLKNINGKRLAEFLHDNKTECEYADGNYIVMMFTPENTPADFDKLRKTLTANSPQRVQAVKMRFPVPQRVLSVRQAFFAPSEVVSVDNAVGRICGVPLVTCPPAVPVVMSGEVIDDEMLPIFKYYGIDKISVLK